VCVYEVLESGSQEDFDARKKLDSLMHLAELCIEVIQQNEEYHAEVSQQSGASIRIGQGGHVPPIFMKGDIHGNVPPIF